MPQNGVRGKFILHCSIKHERLAGGLTPVGNLAPRAPFLQQRFIPENPDAQDF